MSQSSSRAQRRAAGHHRHTAVFCNELQVTSLDGVVYLAVGHKHGPVAIAALHREDLEGLIDGLISAHEGVYGERL